MLATFTHWAARPLPRLPRGVLPRGPVAYLDIETTGLVADSAHVTLVGLAWAERGGRRLKQFFVDHPRREGDVLRAVRSELRGFAGTVTYNGNSFDLPFLRRRARVWRLRWPWIETYHLLHVARAWRRQHGGLASCRLQAVMTHFCVERADHASGYDMVRAYFRWLKRREPGARRIILEHNADDVLLLPKIVPHLLRRPTRTPSRRNRRAHDR